jgi:hypothetical protein
MRTFRTGKRLGGSLMSKNETYENGLLPFYEKYGIDECYNKFWDAVIQEEFDKWLEAEEE